LGQNRDAIRQEIEATRERMDQTVEAIGYKADVVSRTKEAIGGRRARARQAIADRRYRTVASLSNAKDRAVESLVGAKESVSSTAGDVTPSRGDIQQGARRTAGLAQENPMGLAVGSLAVGFLAGMLLPSTTIEKEKVGPVADQVREKVKETGQEALDRGRQVVESLPQAAEEAKQSVSEKVAETAKDQAQELASSTKERAKDISS
jgi:ElaB/YqjD/DUF883 family membrane-anchored ribosome-binding protein